MFVLWLLGPTSSGKTTIASELLIRFRGKGLPVIHYDGDEIRNFFGETIGFSAIDRHRVVSTIVYLANKASDAELNVIVSALTANLDDRSFVKDNVNNLIVGYIKCSLDECIRRDPKGLYSKAKKGEIDTLIGFNQEYPEPENPDMILETENKSPEEIVEYIEDFLSKK
jgi:adenylylsulfate kinase-like enzyme